MPPVSPVKLPPMLSQDFDYHDIMDDDITTVINNCTKLQLNPSSVFYQPQKRAPRFEPNLTKLTPFRRHKRKVQVPLDSTYGLAYNLLSRLERYVGEFEKELSTLEFPTDYVESNLDPFNIINEEKEHWDRCTQLILPDNQENPEIYVPYLINFHRKIDEKIQKERIRLKDNLPLHLQTDPFEDSKSFKGYNLKARSTYELVFLMKLYYWKGYVEDRKRDEDFYFHQKRLALEEQLEDKENNLLNRIPCLKARNSYDISYLFATELTHKPKSQKEAAKFNLLQTANEELVKMPAVDAAAISLRQLDRTLARLDNQDPDKRDFSAKKLEAAKKNGRCDTI